MKEPSIVELLDIALALSLDLHKHIDYIGDMAMAKIHALGIENENSTN